MAGTRKASALAWKRGSLGGQRDPCTRARGWPGAPAGAAALPDAHGGLDEGGDAHAGEDGADEVADGELVLAHAQALGQQEGHGNGAAEAGQVVLGARGGSAGLGGAHRAGNGDLGSATSQAVPGSRAGCRGTRGARPRSCRACPSPAGGAWCPPRGPAGGAQLSLCHPAPWEPLCPQGGEGSLLAALHPQGCHSWIWGGGLPPYSPCPPQAAPSQGGAGSPRGPEPSSHSGSEDEEGTGSVWTQMSLGKGAGLCSEGRG